MNNIIRLVGLLVIVAFSSIAYLIARPLMHHVLYSGAASAQDTAFDIMAVFGTILLGFVISMVAGAAVTALYFIIKDVLLEIGEDTIGMVRKILRR